MTVDDILANGFTFREISPCANCRLGRGDVEWDLMHEIMPFCGAELVIRKGSVDRENVEWMAQSLFVKALRNAAVSPGELVVDLGAHIGSFSILAAKERRARVIAFEPDDESLGIARANALINGVSELVECDHSAVGGRDGTALLFQSSDGRLYQPSCAARYGQPVRIERPAPPVWPAPGR